MATPSPTWQRQGRGSTAHYTLGPIRTVGDEAGLQPAAYRVSETNPTNFNPESIDPSEQATYGVPNPALGAFANERVNIYPPEDGTVSSAHYGPGFNSRTREVDYPGEPDPVRTARRFDDNTHNPAPVAFLDGEQNIHRGQDGISASSEYGSGFDPRFRKVDYNGEAPPSGVEEHTVSRKPLTADRAHHTRDRGHARDGVGGMGHIPEGGGQGPVLHDLGHARTGTGGMRHVHAEDGNIPVQDHGHPTAGVGGMGHVYAEDGAVPSQDHGHPRAGVGGMGHAYAEDGEPAVQDHGHATKGVGGMGHTPAADAQKEKGGRRNSLMAWVHKHTGSK